MNQAEYDAYTFHYLNGVWPSNRGIYIYFAWENSQKSFPPLF